MKKIHEISVNNFHGWHTIRLYGAAEGFELSTAQYRKVQNELCGFSDCRCGGGYGDGYEKGSAKLESTQYSLRLIPAED